MSGGRWDYRNDYACEDIFKEFACYGIGSDEQKKMARNARKRNPLKDPIISELAFDLFCVLHSCDWFLSGDICEETYEKDVTAFKNKWLKFHTQKRVKEYIDEVVEDTKQELYKTLEVNE